MMPEATTERGRQRYIGDKTSQVVHDSLHEDPTPGGCQLRRLLKSQNAVRFEPDRLGQARSEGYSLCPHCFFRLEARPNQALKNLA